MGGKKHAICVHGYLKVRLFVFEVMLKRIKLTDVVVLLFLLFSGIIILFGRKETEHFSMLISTRVVAFFIMLILIKLHNDFNNKIIKFLRYFYPLIFTVYFYGETGYYNNIFFADLDSLFIHAEDYLFGFQPSLWFSAAYSAIWFNELMFFSYFSFYLIIFGFSLALYFKKNQEFEKAFFIIIFSLYSYYLFFVLFPVVGPQFYYPPEFAGIPHPLFFGKLMQVIQEIGETPTGAFPSSHVGLSWIILIIASKTYKKLLFIIYPLAILICYSTVYIKAHYFIDVLAGFISAPFLYYAGLKIYENLNKMQGYLTAKPISKY